MAVTRERFEQFLRSEGVFDQFYEARVRVGRRTDQELFSLEPGDWLNSCFSWSRAETVDHILWGDLHNKWLDEMDNPYIPPNPDLDWGKE